ncbi:ABC transporter permease [Polyangium aurulentum]|uniref:ABC transporter permease n=1 Tax=Polyangium aurulentum TaxID=2567896 RepID=UPI0010ADC781|nr:ABC transporter permease [Polyangium aurulentum]UQA56155.1 ABC transporter permease [Polyangium aurulentum]
MTETTAPSATKEPEARGRGKRRNALGPTYGALLALVVLVTANALFTPNFASASNLWNILLQVSTTVLVAVGMTLVMATGGIDLSVGSIMAVASALGASLLGSGVGVAVAAGLAAGTALGLLNGALVSAFRIQPFIVTLALLITGRGVAQVINEGNLVPFNNPTFESLGRGRIGPVPAQALIMVLVVAVALVAMRSTTFGRYAIAVGGNESAARLAGVPIHRTKIAVYALSGLLAGLAGLIDTARLGASDAAKIGLNIELDAIAAVVVGGTPLTGGRATIGGTVIGALIMQVITTSFNMRLIPFSWSLVIKAAIILIAVYIQRPRAH